MLWWSPKGINLSLCRLLVVLEASTERCGLGIGNSSKVIAGVRGGSMDTKAGFKGRCELWD